ncbi:Putative transposase similar to Tn10 [Photobacterium profundum SS9]|uniref:Transposase similar to Tn10 n=1 Tax=Photobacterium profundum (strain SS9) TaxID=298386 RepID=Q6LGR5_PHOPR|nr:Putative transposase similar to Tn10 [Photobacterium profundum SS9]
MDSVQALLSNDALTLTLLGRSLPSKAKTKHCIKRVDRLLGNNHLHHDRLDIYRWHCHQFCWFCRILELECRNTYPQIQLGRQGVKLLPSRHISSIYHLTFAKHLP